jgi:hypothetical protein
MLRVLTLRGKATFALVKGNKDSPEGTKSKLQIEGRAPTAIAMGTVVKFDPRVPVFLFLNLSLVSNYFHKTPQRYKLSNENFVVVIQ